MSRIVAALLLSLLILLPAFAQENLDAGIPITFTLAEPAHVTLVIDDANGKRVRNLVGNKPFPAGTHTIVWDGYDAGQMLGDKKPDDDPAVAYSLTRKRVAPGTYYVKALLHKGIELHYQFSVNSAGEPPWPTADGTGGWFADHTPPSSILFLPKGSDKGAQPQMLVVSHVAESGDSWVWLDTHARRIFGTAHLGDMAGAQYLARDDGAQPVSDVYAYAEAQNGRGEVRVAGLRTDGTLQHVIALKTTEENKERSPHACLGIAAYNGRLAASLICEDKLALIDARPNVPLKKRLIGYVDVPSPKGVCFDKNGRLFVATESSLKSFDVDWSKPALLNEKTLAEKLDDPHQVTVDERNGDLYVSERGASHQIKVFDRRGKFLRAIGKAGGIKLGPFDEQCMNCPNGLAFDADGRLWVIEASSTPKRLLIWTKTGELVLSKYGSPRYGAGGVLDPLDKSRFYYDEAGAGMEFKLDWEQGTSRLSNIYFLDAVKQWGVAATPLRSRMPYELRMWGEGMTGEIPVYPVYVNGHQYLTKQYEDNGGSGAAVALWLYGTDGIIRPVAAVGSLEAIDNAHHMWAPLKQDDIRPLVDAAYKSGDHHSIFVIWSDLNFDQKVQPEELQFISKMEFAGLAGKGSPALFVDKDLSFTDGLGIHVPAPERFTAAGVPVWDIKKMNVGFKSARPKLKTQSYSPGGEPVTGEGGWAVDIGRGIYGYKNGECQWQYENRWNSAYAGRFAPRPTGPGELYETMKLLGWPVKPNTGEAGEMFAVDSNLGLAYLMTMDGYFVTDIGEDVRLCPGIGIAYPKAERGMRVENVTFGQEDYYPSMTQTADGKIYVVYGHHFSGLFELTGFEHVKRCQFGTCEVTAEMLAGKPEVKIEQTTRGERKALNVALATTPPAVDGKLDDWVKAEWATLDDNTSAAVQIADGKLFAAFKTHEPDFLANSGAQGVPFLFKTGTALDLMLGASSANLGRSAPEAGDERVLVTLVKGKVTAALYRQVAPGANPEARMEYRSPLGTINFDEVADISDKVTLAGGKDGNYELSIPLAALDLKPLPGGTISADIGILRGTAMSVAERVYWTNKGPVVTNVSDVPSEARLTPSEWGVWRFHQRK